MATSSDIQSKPILQEMLKRFRSRFNTEPTVITYAPGRIEVLG